MHRHRLLCQIQTDSSNLPHGFLSPIVVDTSILALRCRTEEGKFFPFAQADVPVRAFGFGPMLMRATA